MNEYHIHDAIGEISEELIDPVAKLRQKKRYPVIKWVAAAACLCLLLSLPLGASMRNGMKAEGSVGAPEMNMEILYGAISDEAKESSDMATEVSVFRAKVLEVDEKCVLVAPLEGEAELRSSDKIYVSVWKLKQIPEIKAGNILEIRYDGMIQETYPPQINGIYSIAVIE